MFAFHPYGLLISLGLVAGLTVAWWRKKLYGITENDLENLFILTVPLGIIGARIYHVLDKWSYYSQNLNQIFAVWNGGLGIYGGVLGGLVGLGIFWRIKSKKVMPNLVRHPSKILKQVQDDTGRFLNLLDFLMPSLAIGQAIGRWGNFFNQEVFGPPTPPIGGLTWGWYIPANLRPEMWKNYSFFQPTFAYESIWVLIGFFILLFLERKIIVLFFGVQRKEPKEIHPVFVGSKSKVSLRREPSKKFCFPFLTQLDLLRRLHKREGNENYDFAKGTQYRPGMLTGFYAVWYGVGRFGFEFLRFDTAEIWGIKTAQIISLLLIVFGIYLIIGRNRVLQRQR